MEDQDFQNRVDALCAEMRETLRGQRALLDKPDLTFADRGALLRDILMLLTTISEMQPQHTRTDFAPFAEMATFEPLNSDQRRRILTILEESTAN